MFCNDYIQRAKFKTLHLLGIVLIPKSPASTPKKSEGQPSTNFTQDDLYIFKKTFIDMSEAEEPRHQKSERVYAPTCSWRWSHGPTGKTLSGD